MTLRVHARPATQVPQSPEVTVPTIEAAAAVDRFSRTASIREPQSRGAASALASARPVLSPRAARSAPRLPGFDGPAISPDQFPPRAPDESQAHYEARLHSVGNQMEAEFLSSRGPGVGSYGPFTARSPVLLVHGINDSPGDMMVLAERVDALGRQALFFFYDDRHASVDESATALARALRLLRGTYPRGDAAEIDIVAHSVGGLISRAALGVLGDADSESARRAGFSRINVTTLDTPWGGVPNGMPQVFADIADLPVYSEMGADSAMFERLHRLPLPSGVSMHHIAADQAVADPHAWLCDLSDDEIHFVARALRPVDAEGFPYTNAPGPHRWQQLRNFIFAIREDAAYRAIRASLETGEDGRSVLRRFFPAVQCTHREMLFSSDAFAVIQQRLLP